MARVRKGRDKKSAQWRTALVLLGELGFPGHHAMAGDILRGGQPGALGRQWVERADGTREEMGGRDSRELRPGDVFVVQTPGGGGFGPA